MSNKEIANTFNELAKIMELHGENPFKIRSYQNAYLQLRKLEKPLADMSDEELEAIKGVGKAISSKVRELESTGQLETLNKYLHQTPPGIREMLGIKGFGPKKIAALWKQLGIESVGELLYACNENRLIELKGFGQKTQEDLRKKLEYFQQSKGKYHYAALEGEAELLIGQLELRLPGAQLSLCGAIRRREIIIDGIDILIASADSIEPAFDKNLLQLIEKQGNTYLAKSANDTRVTLYHCSPRAFGSKLFRYTGSPAFLEAFVKQFVKQTAGIDFKGLAEESQVFDKAGMQAIPPELREDDRWLAQAEAGQLPELITKEDIKGVLHAHTTYSDGIHSLEEMAKQAHRLGYEYIGITDHSKSAFYANGLKEDRLLQQMQEIDALNEKMTPFRIFKGIESDILYDGSLDYSEEVLARFDFIIASVHSNLKMDESKATARLIAAIENPYTSILGHPTGRLLLSREGYPIDHSKVIDACAANGVAIELNANPYRLDLGWQWIGYAMQKGVRISINPDAHSREGILHIHFGLLAARKGGLTAAACLNSLSTEEFAQHIKKK